MSCSVGDLFGGIFDKVEKILDSIDDQIKTINLEIEGFDFLGILKDKLFKKIKDIKSDFYGKVFGKNLNFAVRILTEFLGTNKIPKKLLVKTLKEFYKQKRDERKRYRENLNPNLNSDDIFSNIEITDDLYLMIDGGVGNLIFLTAHTLDYINDLVDERNEESIDLSENISLALQLVDDTYVFFSDQNKPTNLKNKKERNEFKIEKIELASIKILDSILELNQLELNIKSNNFDSKAYVESRAALQEILNELSTENIGYSENNFLDVFSSIQENIEKISELNTEIREVKENFYNFFDNFKQSFVQEVNNKEKVLSIISDLRIIKNKMDSYLASSESYSPEIIIDEIVPSLSAIIMRMIEIDRTVLDEIEEVFSLPSDDEGREEINIYEQTSVLLKQVEEDTNDSIFEEKKLILNNTLNNLGDDYISNLNQIREILNELQEYNVRIQNNNNEYGGIFSGYSVRENNWIDGLLRSFRGTDWEDLYKDIKRGNWGSFFTTLQSGIINSGIIKSDKVRKGLNCLLESGFSFSNLQKNIISSFTSKLDFFKQRGANSLASIKNIRENALSKAKITKEKQKEFFASIGKDAKKELKKL